MDEAGDEVGSAAARTEGERGPSHNVLRAIEGLAGPLSRIRLRTDATPGATDPARPVSIGPTGVLGRFQVVGEIGRGGMGVVLRGRDTDLGRDVALKVLGERHAERPEVVQRFVEEAQLGGQLQHPGIVPVYELGLSADERPYFAMKLVKGRTLAALLADRPDGLDRRRLIDIFASVCQTLGYAHSRGVIHRDLKPSNVMVGAFGEVQLVDWGLAKVLRGEPSGAAVPTADLSVIQTVRSAPGADTTHSLVGSVLGTPAYMSPEQARGEIDLVDERSDVFALGAILCELLTGKPPYVGGGAAQLEAAAAGRLDDARARLAACAADPDLVSIAVACLDADPASRPADAGALARLVLEHLSSVEERGRRAQLEAAEARAKAASEQRARRLTLALASTVVAALVLAAGGWVWLSGRAERRARAASEGIAAALAEASLERGNGRFSEALGALGRARGLAGSGDVGADLARRVEDQVAGIEAEIRIAREEDELLRDTEALLSEVFDVRLPINTTFAAYSTDLGELEREYARIFARHGLDPDADPGATAAAFARRGRPVELSAMLDEWSTLRLKAGDRPGSARLRELSRRLDTDLVRDRLRAAADAGPEVLRELAAQLDIDALPVPTQSLLGTQLATSGAIDEAVAVFQRAMALHPDDYTAAMNAGRALRMVRPARSEEASRAFSAALALRPESLAAVDALTTVLHDLAEYERAIELLEIALARHPDDARLLGKLAREQLGAGRSEAAMATAREALARDPDEIIALVVESTALLEVEKDVEGAIAAARRAVELDPQDARMHHNLGRALAARGDVEEAMAAYRRAIALEPGLSGAYNNLGGLHSARGEYAEAIAARRKAVELDPRNEAAISSLAWLLAMCPDESLRDPEEALTWARKELELAGRTANALNNLGAALCSAGRWDEAVQALSESLERSAGRDDGGYLAAVDHALLATAHARSNRPDEARAELALAEALAEEWVAAHPRSRARELPQTLEAARRAVAEAPPPARSP
jgi:tetratricopeptide (TPR) repeat protein